MAYKEYNIFSFIYNYEKITSVDSRTALKKPSKNSLHKLGKKSNFLNSQLTGWGWNGLGWDMRRERGRETL